MNRIFVSSAGLAFFLCAVLLIAAPAHAAYAGGYTGNLNLFLGQKNLDDDDWAPVEDQPEVGGTLDFRGGNWPVSAAIDFLYSTDKEDIVPGLEAEGTTWELDLGIRKVFDEMGIIKPFVGGGLAIINGEVKATAFGLSANEDDTGFGFWLDGGVYFTLAQHFNIGAEIRYSKADITIAGVDGDAGGLHFGLLLGYHW